MYYLWYGDTFYTDILWNIFKRNKGWYVFHHGRVFRKDDIALSGFSVPWQAAFFFIVTSKEREREAQERTTFFIATTVQLINGTNLFLGLSPSLNVAPRDGTNLMPRISITTSKKKKWWIGYRRKKIKQWSRSNPVTTHLFIFFTVSVYI